MKHIVLVFCCVVSFIGSAQKRPLGRAVSDSTQQILKGGVPGLAPVSPLGIDSYKIISFARDTVSLDTTLTIKKEYAYNFLRKDDFELLPFANVGQPYNTLGVTLGNQPWRLGLGASAKHFNYFEKEDVAYYNVATPLSDLFFKTTFDEGQMLDALVTFNTSRRLNFGVAYKGFRSQGKYQYQEAKSGNFRFSVNYVTENAKYAFRGHMATQELENEENGGVTKKEEQFESGDARFTDRSRIDVLFSNADNTLVGRRYYMDQAYYLLGNATVDSASLAVVHDFSYESKYYQFTQTAQNSYFGAILASGEINDKSTLKSFDQGIGVQLKEDAIGELTAKIRSFIYRYRFNSILTTDEGVIPSSLTGNMLGLEAAYKKEYKGVTFKVDVMQGLADDLVGSSYAGSLSYKRKGIAVNAGIQFSSRMPNFNYLLYQSDYENYNWYTKNEFKKEQIAELSGGVSSSLLGNLQASVSTVANWSYFGSAANDIQIADGLESAFVKPMQAGFDIQHLKLTYDKEFSFGMFALNNRIMYQQVRQDQSVLHVPDVVARSTFYLSKHVFNKAMYVQAGITAKYFSAYYANSYNPLLGEFFVQDAEKVGGFPMLDFFINAKVQQTRIYLKAEHFNSGFGTPSYYSAPNYPYRDFVVRFGLVWNFFS